jgi:hypothetical protein
MLEGLQDEIKNWPQLLGASPKLVMDVLNKPGSFIGVYTDDAEWTVKNEPAMISKSELMTRYLSLSSGQAFSSFLDKIDPFNRYVNRLFSQVEGNGIDMSLGTVRDLFTYIYQTGSICTESEYHALMKLGERQLSRAEELFGRKLTEEDFA